MAPEAVIDRQRTAYPAVARLWALEAQAVGPFVKQGLDEAFGFGVSPSCVGPSALGAQAQEHTVLPTGIGAVGAAVIR